MNNICLHLKNFQAILGQSGRKTLKSLGPAEEVLTGEWQRRDPGCWELESVYLTHETKETRLHKSCCEPRKTSWWSSWESKRVLTASRHHYLLRVGLRAQCGPEDFILKNQEWPRMKVLSLGHAAGAGWFSPTQMDSFYLVNYLRGPVYLFIHLFAFINVASFWHKTFFFFKKKKDSRILK